MQIEDTNDELMKEFLKDRPPPTIEEKEVRKKIENIKKDIKYLSAQFIKKNDEGSHLSSDDMSKLMDVNMECRRIYDNHIFNEFMNKPFDEEFFPVKYRLK